MNVIVFLTLRGEYDLLREVLEAIRNSPDEKDRNLINDYEYGEMTALEIALDRGRFDIAELLVEYGLDVNVASRHFYEREGFSLLYHWAQVYTGSHGYECLKFLLKNGIDVNSSDSLNLNHPNKGIPLCAAMWGGSCEDPVYLDKVKLLVEDYHADLFAFNSLPLRLALKNEADEAVEYLIGKYDRFDDILQTNELRFYLLETTNIRIAKLLLELLPKKTANFKDYLSGHNIEECDDEHNFLLESSCCAISAVDITNLLSSIIFRQKNLELVPLLMKLGVDINHPDCQLRFVDAVLHGKVDVVKCFIKYGINVRECRSHVYGDKSLLQLLYEHYPYSSNAEIAEIERLLLEHGAE